MHQPPAELPRPSALLRHLISNVCTKSVFASQDCGHGDALYTKCLSFRISSAVDCFPPSSGCHAAGLALRAFPALLPGDMLACRQQRLCAYRETWRALSEAFQVYQPPTPAVRGPPHVCRGFPEHHAVCVCIGPRALSLPATPSLPTRDVVRSTKAVTASRARSGGAGGDQRGDVCGAGRLCGGGAPRGARRGWRRGPAAAAGRAGRRRRRQLGRPRADFPGARGPAAPPGARAGRAAPPRSRAPGAFASGTESWSTHCAECRRRVQAQAQSAGAGCRRRVQAQSAGCRAVLAIATRTDSAASTQELGTLARFV